MKERVATTLTILLILGFSSASNAEYLIYLKGGHYIVADNCTFSTRQVMRKDAETEEKAVVVEDCTKGKPDGRIFWSTIDGKFGEVNADDVYAIFGAKSLTLKKPPPAKGPLEDYLITNRGESFVVAKAVEQEKDRIYGVKRDELARIDRRVVMEIVPEGSAKSRSGEGLCPGEPAEFSVSEVELVGGNFVGVVTNLSQIPWRPWFEVEVREKGAFKGKFRVPDSVSPDVNIVSAGESTVFDGPVPGRFLKYLERVTDPEASVRLCYKKVKTVPRQPAVEQSLTVQPSK
ncbi:MAG: hypothetical protein HY278_08220 [candidate division NC10 bacterium]|nr:hypothetical protein [candidate division NC10 bacterium]